MKQPTISVEGKRIVLTGAPGFLGLHIARALADEGATVIAIDVLPPREGTAHFEKAGIDVAYYQCDITEERTMKSTAKDIAEKFGGVDVLINNAAFNPKVEGGKNVGTTFDNYPIERWEQELRVNITGTMLACRTIRPLMASGASIVNVASIYALVGPDQRIYTDNFEKPAVYGASKAAVLSLTKHLATLWGKDGIRVNAVVYGGFENEQDPDFVERYSERVPLGRMAQGEEATGIIVFLASDAASYATGGVFTIDGGWTAW